MPEAFDSGPLRVPRQIAQALDMQLEDVELVLADAAGRLDWQEVLTVDLVFQVAASLGVSCYLFSPFLVRVETRERNGNAKSLVFAQWGAPCTSTKMPPTSQRSDTWAS